MQITMHPTNNLAQMDGNAFRIWHGTTTNGNKVTVLVAIVSCDKDDQQAIDELKASLTEVPCSWVHEMSAENKG